MLQHNVPDRVGVDGAEAVFLQQPANLALTGADAAGEQPAAVLRSHNGRR
jgi:hypothetical protein